MGAILGSDLMSGVIAGWLWMLAAVALAGCSGWEPLEVPDREYPKGSGLFSGEDGEFVVFRR